MHRTFAKVNLSEYKKNLQKIKNLIRDEVQLMAIVKADGYGHGVIPISQAAISSSVSYLGVACITEAQELRANGINQPILLLSEPVFDVAQEIVNMDITQTLYTQKWAEVLNNEAKKLKKKAKVHCKIDTGMGRIGLDPETAPAFIKNLKNLEHLELEGIFTHFAKADDKNSAYTHQQYKIFKKFLAELKASHINISLIHAANSDALKNYPETHFNMVRVGLSSYENVLNFISHVGYIKKVPANTCISYGCEFTTSKETYIATVMAGYGDGVPKSLGNVGRVLINGQSYPIVGRICMDMFMVNIGANGCLLPEQINIGDETVIIGRQKESYISMSEICQHTKQIPYEVMCGISKRVPRIYI